MIHKAYMTEADLSEWQDIERQCVGLSHQRRKLLGRLRQRAFRAGKKDAVNA